MHNPLGVGITQGLQNTGGDLEDEVEGQGRVALNELRQGFAVDILHHQVETGFGRVDEEIIDSGDIGMVQTGQQAGFLQ